MCALWLQMEVSAQEREVEGMGLGVRRRPRVPVGVGRRGGRAGRVWMRGGEAGGEGRSVQRRKQGFVSVKEQDSGKKTWATEGTNRRESPKATSQIGRGET